MPAWAWQGVQSIVLNYSLTSGDAVMGLVSGLESLVWVGQDHLFAGLGCGRRGGAAVPGSRGAGYDEGTPRGHSHTEVDHLLGQSETRAVRWDATVPDERFTPQEQDKCHTVSRYTHCQEARRQWQEINAVLLLANVHLIFCASEWCVETAM